MVYDDDPRAPMQYGIRSEDRANPSVPMEPPQSDEVRALVGEVANQIKGLSAERIHLRILRHYKRHDISLAVVNYVVAEMRAAEQSSPRR